MRRSFVSKKVPGTWVLMFRITTQFSLSSGGVPSANRAIASSSRFSFSEVICETKRAPNGIEPRDGYAPRQLT